MNGHCARIALTLIAVWLCACVATPSAERGSYAMAVPDTFAADVARRVFEDGGNAVDAAVAVGFSLAVTYPEAGNIGGGGFMLIRLNGETAFLDYREVAPNRATPDMYLDEHGDVVSGLSVVGALAVGVPGTVAGLAEAHRRYGRLSWTRLLEDAIQLADKGFVVPAGLAEEAANESRAFAAKTNFHDHFGDLETGRMLRQPALAQTLRRIATNGRDGFYRGDTAAMIVASMRRHGGLIDEGDLVQYRPVWREPLRSEWRGLTILTAPPPSSGGIALIQLLGMKDALAADFGDVGHNSAGYVHLVAEMEKRVFADRAEYLGDPDAVAVPVAELTDPDYIRGRAATVDRAAISAIDASPPGLDSRSTTHYSLLDPWGNAVSNTYTLNTSFGSGVVVDGAGFLLNNEMDDFSAKPRTPNYYGVVGGARNAIAPRKRMLSSMTPTMVLDGEDVVTIIGTPGGSTIFTSVFQALINMADFDMSAQQAVAATRFHHQLIPNDLITISPGRSLAAGARAKLEAMGYRIEPHAWDFGDLQIVRRVEDSYETGVDPRGRGRGLVAEP